MATSVAFASTPKTAECVISAANTNRDGTGTIVDLYTAPSGGARVDDISIKATGTTTQGKVRMYIKRSGGSYRIHREIDVSALTPSASVSSFETLLSALGIILASGDIIGFSTHNAETFHIVGTRIGEF